MVRIYNEKRTRQSELLQILILDALYALSGSQRLTFQGGTALRWAYGGQRFSEDLDFVSGATMDQIERIIDKSYSKTELACLAQFGPGKLERQIKRSRKTALKTVFIYRPDRQRERIAVKVDLEQLAGDRQPETDRFILRDLPAISALATTGRLLLPYSSSIIVVETALEILADKIRALYERPYIKGRDIFDIWWLVDHLNLGPRWPAVHAAFIRYRERFRPAREPDYFQSKQSRPQILQALETDLPRFLPPEIFLIHYEKKFAGFLKTTEQLTSHLLRQGMKDFIDAAPQR